jgi:putative membrane protein
MQFLKTLFWVVLTGLLVLFARANWTTVTLRLWGGLIADVKLPILVLAAFLIGWLPTLILHRARIWSLKRRIEPNERSSSPIVVAPTPATPAVVGNGVQDRVATDSKAWPTP